MSRPTNVASKSVVLLLAGILPTLSCLSQYGLSKPVDGTDATAPRPKSLWKVLTGG